MGQLTIYLPDETLRAVQRAARQARKSVSAYVASLVAPRSTSGRKKRLRAIYGSWEGPVPAIPDPPPERMDW